MYIYLLLLCAPGRKSNCRLLRLRNLHNCHIWDKSFPLHSITCKHFQSSLIFVVFELVGQRRVKLMTFMAVGLRRDHFKVFFEDQRQSDAWSALKRIFVVVKVVYGGVFCRLAACLSCGEHVRAYATVNLHMSGWSSRVLHFAYRSMFYILRGYWIRMTRRRCFRRNASSSSSLDSVNGHVHALYVKIGVT